MRLASSGILGGDAVWQDGEHPSAPAGHSAAEPDTIRVLKRHGGSVIIGSAAQNPPDPEETDISVVVPVYDPGELLRELLDSLVRQDLAKERYEVIAVDDGSTDGSAAVLDEYAARHSFLHVVHQENSGWPGVPRNRGLDLARGRYVFFADADDLFGTEALRRMVMHADRLGSDVLLPKLGSLGGRWVPGALYEQTCADVDLVAAAGTLGPQKLFRRSMLLEHELRFPEEKVRLEDGMFVMRAYYTARHVSVAGDYEYYYLRAREDGGNISKSRFDPDGYTWSVGRVSEIVRTMDPDPERAGRMILDLFRRKCLKFYRAERFLRMKPARRQAFIRAHQRFQTEFIPEALERRLEEPALSRSRLVRAGDVESLLQLAHERDDAALDATVASARLGPRGARLNVRLTPGAGRTLDEAPALVVRARGTEPPGEAAVTLHRDRSGAFQARVGPLDLVRLRTRGLLDFYVRAVIDGHERLRRISCPEGVLPTGRRLGLYRTAKGNLSGR